MRNVGGKFQIFLMDSAGGVPSQLTFGDRSNLFPPAFSPDGQSLVYISTTDNVNNLINRVGINGGAPQPILTAARINSVAVTPGGQLLFNSNVAPNVYRLFRANADGSQVQDITGSGNGGIFVTTSPDGTSIAYDQIVNSGAVNIYTRRVVGGDQSLLVSDAILPSWGAKVAQ
jgi:Tol biopolymer transport system component